MLLQIYSHSDVLLVTTQLNNKRRGERNVPFSVEDVMFCIYILMEGIMCRKKDYFKDLCKAYPLQKQLQQALEMKMKQSSDEMLQKQYQAVLTQVEQVEKIMHYMKVVHGKMAMDMFVSYYIDGVRQKDIAYQYHMSLRTLQRRFQNYRSLLEEVFRHRIDCV